MREDNELLTRTGPGRRAGRMMRRYRQPGEKNLCCESIVIFAGGSI